MSDTTQEIAAFLESVHPYDNLSTDERNRIARKMNLLSCQAGDLIYRIDDPLGGVFVIMSGEVETIDRNGAMVSLLTARNTFGERGFLRDGNAATTARATQQARILQLPAAEFRRLLKTFVSFQRYFNRAQRPQSRPVDIATQKVSELIARAPLHCPPSTTAAQAAQIMREHHVSSLGITEPGTDTLMGIVTVRDLANRVLAEGLDPSTPVRNIMTTHPVTLPSSALGSDVLHQMLEHKVGHLPIVERGSFVGMITQTDITRFQAISAAGLVRDISNAATVPDMAAISRRIPSLLVQLVGASQTHEVVTRLITDIADTITRRLLQMAEEKLGPAPVPYLWLACGSQGRQEQSGVSDQDNCLFLHDSVTQSDMAYFQALASSVSDGLNECGYVYCPGDMMATNPRWCQPVKVWRDYFHTWAVTHKPESHMLASVMFDLRPIGGTAGLYRDLQAETLEKASKNSIFVAHMIANSLKHVPPLGLIRGFSTVRSGPYRNHIDLKHNGVIPVTDLARVYALQGRITDVNTRARLLAAEDAGIISASGARDLIEAYDVIAMTRLQNQANLVKVGRAPSNFLAPADLSDFERNHLRDAFVVVRTMQSAIGHGQGALR
jgi:CBS domain-containing protein